MNHLRPSIRLSLWIVIFVALLCVAIQAIMLYFTYLAMKEETAAIAKITQLQWYVLGITILVLVILFAACLFYINRQLRPLQQLDTVVQRIAEGHFDEPIPPTSRTDEIGHLQRTFHTMQRSITDYLEETHRRNSVLSDHNGALEVAYERAKEADHAKSAFLQNMTDMMVPPVKAINEIVDTIYEEQEHLRLSRISTMAEQMEKQTKIVTSLLSQILDVSEKPQTP